MGTKMAVGWFRLFLVFLTLGGMTEGARAERRGDPEGAAKEKEAREHYTKGMTHFDLGEIEEAVAEFKQAYAISNAPGLLFNIAQAFRYKKDYEQALHFYNSYLRLQPRAANRADVEARVAEMEKMIKEQERLGKERPIGVLPPARDGEDNSVPSETPAPTPGVTTTPASAPTPAAAPVLPPRPHFLSTGGGRATVALAGLAGLCAITAGALGGVALSTRNDYRSGCDRGACDDAKYDRAHGLAVGADVLWGLGAASAVGALVVGLVTRSSLNKPGVYAQGQSLVWSF